MSEVRPTGEAQQLNLAAVTGKIRRKSGDVSLRQSKTVNPAEVGSAPIHAALRRAVPAPDAGETDNRIGTTTGLASDAVDGDPATTHLIITSLPSRLPRGDVDLYSLGERGGGRALLSDGTTDGLPAGGTLNVDLSGLDVPLLSFMKPERPETERVRLPEELRELDELLPEALVIQQKFAEQGVPIVLAGGLATDLHARETIPGHETRKHKDIDFLVPHYVLTSWGRVLEDMGFDEYDQHPDLFNDNNDHVNLRIFVKDGVRIDLMGYRTFGPEENGISEVPQMSWGEVDTRLQPVSMDPNPVTIQYGDGTLQVLSPDSLLRLKTAQKLDREETKQRDLAVLQDIIARSAQIAYAREVTEIVESYVQRSGPNPRLLELNVKAAEQELTPQEEAERRGLSAYPDSPYAQRLLQKEYLSKLGLGEFSRTEREQLRLIRVEQHKREEETTKKVKTKEHRPYQIGTENSNISERENLGVLYMNSRIAALENSWEDDPRAIIESMVAALLDDTRKQPLTQLDVLPVAEPSPLELYLLSRLQSIPHTAKSRPEGTLGVLESIHCIRDEVRTKKFLAGIKESISTLEATGRDTITMCDAGCGALPILAIYAALCSDKVRCTALELNPDSAKIAREVVASLGLEDRITIVEADATTFQPAEELDLLVSETMHSGLTQEPIVQIMANLKPFVKPDGITLPSGVRVKAALVSTEEFRSDSDLVILGGGFHQVVNPDWQDVVEYTPGDNLEEISFTVPLDGVQPGLYMAAVTSEVAIGSQTLTGYQSLITNPQYVRTADGELKPFEVSGNNSQNSIQINYKPGDNLNDVSTVG